MILPTVLQLLKFIPLTNLLFLNKSVGIILFLSMILYINYPFKKTWQLDEVVHTMQLFKVDVVDGIILDDRFYYKHDGSGLKPIVKGGGLHLERDQFYRRVGGVHLINTEFFLKHKKMVFGKIGHIMFDEITGFQIKSDLDFKLAESILELGSIKS